MYKYMIVDKKTKITYFVKYHMPWLRMALRTLIPNHIKKLVCKENYSWHNARKYYRYWEYRFDTIPVRVFPFNKKETYNVNTIIEFKAKFNIKGDCQWIN